MSYWIFIFPIIAGILTQLIKVAIEAARGNFSWHIFKKYGGMPSSHAAFVFALLAEIYYIDGLASTTFALALILTILIIRDASGYRRTMDHHAEIINDLVKKLPAEQQTKFPHLKERMGHTPLEITVGAIIGILIIIIGILIIIIGNFII